MADGKSPRRRISATKNKRMIPALLCSTVDYTVRVKKLFRFTLGLYLLVSTALSASAAFSSLYVFGDTLSATADPTSSGPPYYYGQRWSNGRVWVEVLAQRQGLKYDVTKNNSYWDHNSADLVTDVNNFIAPSDVANDLFIVWVCNADTFDSASTALNNSSTDPNYLLNQFIGANIQAQANHLQIILNLYNKGVRTLVLPNAVDISQIPAYNAGNLTGVLHAGCVDYNARFSNTISQARAMCPGLTIHTPDFFTLLNNVLANPASYGLKNAQYGGFNIDALEDLNPSSLNGPGTNFVFWDPQDPTAQFHEIIADVAQQIISPVQISQLTVLNGSNRLDLANMPLGLNGFVEGVTNLTLGNWAFVTNFNSSVVAQSVFVVAAPLPPPVAASGSGGSTDPNNPGNGTYFPPFNPAQFYRLHFPYSWSWP